VGFPETGSQAPQTQCHNRSVGRSDAWTLGGPTIGAADRRLQELMDGNNEGLLDQSERQELSAG